MTVITTPRIEVNAPVAPPVLKKTVPVELVWPAERGAKIDCRGNTKIVWSAHGDVQDYPADQWYLLAAHPDVWRLVHAEDAATAAQAKTEVIETPEQKVERINREVRVKAEAQHDAFEAERLAARAAKDDAAQTNTDTVLLRAPVGRPLAPPMLAQVLSAAELAELSDEDIQAEGARRDYALHPRLNPVNLRAKFLEHQADAELARRLTNTPGDT